MTERVSLSLFWFFGLGGIGFFFPFFSLYLHENAGLSGAQVGAVTAVLPLVGLVAQPLWGQIADRTGSRTRVLVLLAAGSSAGYAALAVPESFMAFALCTAGLALFATPLVPSAVAVTLALLRDTTGHGFGRVRVWGTLGFLLFVVAFPRALDWLQAARGLAATPGGPSEPGLEVMFLATGAACAAGALAALALPHRGTGAAVLRARRSEWRLLLRHGPFVRLVLYVFGTTLALHGPMTLFPILVRARGGTLASVSDMWILMLALEIPLVYWTGASVARLGARGAIAAGVLAGALRWGVCGLTSDLGAIFAAQILHGVVVFGVAIGAPLYVDAVVPERLRSTAQGLLAMIGVSLGGILSSLAAGALLERVGPDAPYRAGGATALGLLALLPILLPPPRRGPGALHGDEEVS